MENFEPKMKKGEIIEQQQQQKIKTQKKTRKIWIKKINKIGKIIMKKIEKNRKKVRKKVRKKIKMEKKCWEK